AMELERFHPDVVHLSLSFSLLDGWILAECRRRRIPSVVTVHLPYAASSSARGRVLRELYRFHARAMLSADRVIALSPEQSSLLCSVGCDPSRITVLPNSIDTAVFAPGVSALRERLGADFFVAYAGRLDPEKRVPALVESFRRQPWNSRCALVIAGSGSQERQVRRAAADDPRIHLLGTVPSRAEMVDVLRAADVFVLPSTAAGVSLSLLEAMASGCAVIATDAGDDAAALGDAGLLIPVRPLEPALSRALSRLHDDADARRRLGLAGRARIVSGYSMSRRVDDLLSLYESLGSDAAVAA
ncbi:MAG: glycosyltransferase family 4 protein, partial [Candidatus Dormibacteraeota bacterium]|nr:glycosyltransferase family 4 protein [Candidatus Dormibacteraeota bacterium]